MNKYEFEFRPRHGSRYYRWPGRAYVWLYLSIALLPKRRGDFRHWLQRSAYQTWPLWALPLCDALIWLLKSPREHAWDRQIAESAGGMLFVDAAFPNAVLVNESGEKIPYRGGYTYITAGDKVKRLLQYRMPKGHHMEATSMGEKLPE